MKLIPRTWQLLLATALCACGQSNNSNTNDPPPVTTPSPSAPTDTSNDEKAAATTTALALLNHYCAACHDWGSMQSDADWQAAGLVSAGNSAKSKLIRNLKNDGGSMPRNGDALPAADYQSLIAWIDGM
jgi:mono/diheme cytochrome c family protein